MKTASSSRLQINKDISSLPDHLPPGLAHEGWILVEILVRRLSWCSPSDTWTETSQINAVRLVEIDFFLYKTYVWIHPPQPNIGINFAEFGECFLTMGGKGKIGE